MGDNGRTSPLVRFGQLATVLGVLVLIGLLVFGLLAQAPNRSIDEALADGQAARAPDFSLEVLEQGQMPKALGARLGHALTDGQLTLSELRGVPVVLNFWASWCNPCREEAPVLTRGWQRWGRRGVLFVGLDMQDASEDARAFLEEFSITYPIIRDPGKTVSQDFGLTGIPETYFLDADGRVVAHSIGVLNQATLDRDVQAARLGQVTERVNGRAVEQPR